MNDISDIQLAGKRDQVVVFLVSHPKASLLLWAAQKRAQEIGGTWKVVYIETPDDLKEDGYQRRILNLLTHAEQMGAQTEHVQALSLLKGAEDFLWRESPRIATVIVGSTDHENEILDKVRTPQWIKLVKLASQHAKVESVPLSGQFIEPFHQRLLGHIRGVEPKHIVYGLLGMAVPLALATVLQWLLPPIFFRINEQNIDNLFLITAAIVAGRFGLAPGVISAIAGFFINNYYFTLPYHEIKLNSGTDLFGMALFLSAAILVSIFTSQMRRYTQRIRKREISLEMLFTLYRLASESFTRQQAIETIQRNLENMLDAEVAFFLPSALQTRELKESVPADLKLTPQDKQALDACWNDRKCTGVASPFNPGSSWRFEPMIAPSGDVGVLGVRVRDMKQLDAWFGRLLTATADQTAAILSHIELEKSMEDTRINQEREKLRIMLLSSVSHDLKTPLAGIIGALSACQTLWDRLKPAQHKELIAGSLEEAQRLDNFITNILDMTRLETGNIKFRMGWHNPRDLTEQVIKRLEHRLRQRHVSLHFPKQEGEAHMDEVMMGQVLQNLLDNACKYTNPQTPIAISWSETQDGVMCSVRDYGPGIPQENLLSVFDKYTRLKKQDTQPPGTGLGLAISKAILEAQGGWIKAENHREGGAVFSFFLPQWRHCPTVSLIKEEHEYATIR